MRCADLCSCTTLSCRPADPEVHEVETTTVPHGPMAYRLECSCGWVLFEDTLRAAERSGFEHVRDES